VFGASVRHGNAAIGYLSQRQLFDADVRVRDRDVRVTNSWRNNMVDCPCHGIIGLSRYRQYRV